MSQPEQRASIGMFSSRPASSRSTSRALNFATRSNSKLAKPSRNASRFLRIVSQLKPAWALSRTRNSNSNRSSWIGTPHSVSWYWM